MTGRLAGERAVVTGGGRGIGRAVAAAFAAEGAHVMAVARSQEALRSTAAEIELRGQAEEGWGRCAYSVADVTSDGDVARLAGEVRDELGGPPTILVNNAGVHMVRRFMDHTIADWERILAVNVLGTVRVTRAFLPEMLAARRGRILMICSTAGKWGTANQIAYNASKHAMMGITRCLALETAASGIRVNAICPGWVDTELIDEEALSPLLGVAPDQVRETLSARAPIGRMTTADEVAGLAVYLASPEADPITGVGITMAGGMVLI